MGKPKDLKGAGITFLCVGTAMLGIGIAFLAKSRKAG